jgi:hypothetical protein
MHIRPANRRNVLGYVGLGMVLVATVFSPTGFCGLPLLFLVPCGFGGLIICGISLAWAPRWPGAAGLSIGTLCILGWVYLFWSAFAATNSAAAAFGLTVGQHTQMLMSARALAETAEAQRSPTGNPAPAVVITALPPALQTDPWGRPYRYLLVSTPRGYTFISDGPDGLAGTADDIDILTIQYGGMFPLPAPPAPSMPTGDPPP